MTSFSEAVAKRTMTTAEVTGMSTVVDPRTGEILDLTAIDHADLLGAFLALQEREKQFKEWRTVVEDELVRRQTHGNKRKAVEVVGDYEVAIDESWSRVWDPVELDLVAIDLVARGVLTMPDVTGLVVEQELKVDGRKAMALLNRVEGEALTELRRCFTWAQKGRAKVKVTPVASLEP